MTHAYIFADGEIYDIDKAMESSLLAAGLIEWGDDEDDEPFARWSLVGDATIEAVREHLRNEGLL